MYINYFHSLAQIRMEKVKYNKELLDELIKRDGASLIGNQSHVSRDIIIPYQCWCGMHHKKVFRVMHKSGALCKKHTTEQKQKRTASTNTIKYNNPCSVHGVEQQRLTRDTKMRNKVTKAPTPYKTVAPLTSDASIEEIGCIYLITCLENRKQYIGLSREETPDSRYREHLHTRNNKTPNQKPALHRAIDLYGRDKFTIERLCVVPHDGLCNMEAYYAEQFNTYVWDNPGGYNMVWCGIPGNLGVPHSVETRRKISEKAKKRSPESIQRYSESAKKRKPKQISLSNLDKPGKSGPKNKTGYDYIRFLEEKNVYQVSITKHKFYKNCHTIEEAVESRNDFIQSLIV
jgi:group I intron endonuclease